MTGRTEADRVRAEHGRVIERSELATVAAGWREAGRSVVFTNGCFDMLHPGHLALLEECAACGDIVLVGLNDDATVRSLKGNGRPIYPAPERAELLLALRWVDAVTIFGEPTPLETIQLVRPGVLVKGAEYGAGQIVGEDFVIGRGGHVVRFGMRAGYSTSSIVERMKERE